MNTHYPHPDNPSEALCGIGNVGLFPEISEEPTCPFAERQCP